MGFLIERDENHCRNVFNPCAFLPQFRCSRDEESEDDSGHALESHHRSHVPPADKRAGQADMLELTHPKTGVPALLVGTSWPGEYYSSFVGYFDPSSLPTAQSLGIAESFALADDLASTLPLPTLLRGFRL